MERDDVGVREFLQVFEFAHGIGCHTLGVFFLHLYLFDGYLFRRVRSQMAEEHDGVGAFAEFLA